MTFHLGVRHLLPAHGCILEDSLVDEMFHLGDLNGRQGGTGKIKGELVRAHKRSLLGDGIPQHLTESPVEQVGDCVVALDGVATGGINGEGDLGPGQRDFLTL